jgi:hypothetical protein
MLCRVTFMPPKPLSEAVLTHIPGCLVSLHFRRTVLISVPLFSKQAPSMNRDVFIEGHDGFQDPGTLKELGPGLCLGLSSLAEVSPRKFRDIGC